MRWQYIKELKDLFTGWLGTGTVVLYVVTSMVLLWVWPESSYLDFGIASTELYFSVSSYLLIFFIPAIGVGLLSKEFETGTINLLSSLPLSWMQILSAKFLAAMTLIAIMVALTYPSVWLIEHLNLSNAALPKIQLIGSYVGMLLASGVLLALSLFIVTVIQNGSISFIVSIISCYVLYAGFSTIAGFDVLPESIANLSEFISIDYHIANINRGIFSIQNLIYLLSMAALLLFAAKEVITSKEL